MVLMAFRRVRTGSGRSAAPFSVDDSIPPLVDTVDAHRGGANLQYIDRYGATTP